MTKSRLYLVISNCGSFAIVRRHGQHRNSKSLSERVYELERQMKDLTHDGGYL